MEEAIQFSSDSSDFSENEVLNNLMHFVLEDEEDLNLDEAEDILNKLPGHKKEGRGTKESKQETANDLIVDFEKFDNYQEEVKESKLFSMINRKTKDDKLVNHGYGNYENYVSCGGQINEKETRMLQELDWQNEEAEKCKEGQKSGSCSNVKGNSTSNNINNNINSIPLQYNRGNTNPNGDTMSRQLNLNTQSSDQMNYQNQMLSQTQYLQNNLNPNLQSQYPPKQLSPQNCQFHKLPPPQFSNNQDPRLVNPPKVSYSQYSNPYPSPQFRTQSTNIGSNGFLPFPSPVRQNTQQYSLQSQQYGGINQNSKPQISYPSLNTSMVSFNNSVNNISHINNMSNTGNSINPMMNSMSNYSTNLNNNYSYSTNNINNPQQMQQQQTLPQTQTQPQPQLQYGYPNMMQQSNNFSSNMGGTNQMLHSNNTNIPLQMSNNQNLPPQNYKVNTQPIPNSNANIYNNNVQIYNNNPYIKTPQIIQINSNNNNSNNMIHPSLLYTNMNTNTNTSERSMNSNNTSKKSNEELERRSPREKEKQMNALKLESNREAYHKQANQALFNQGQGKSLLPKERLGNSTKNLTLGIKNNTQRTGSISKKLQNPDNMKSLKKSFTTNMDQLKNLEEPPECNIQIKITNYDEEDPYRTCPNNKVSSNSNVMSNLEAFQSNSNNSNSNSNSNKNIVDAYNYSNYMSNNSRHSKNNSDSNMYIASPIVQPYTSKVESNKTIPSNCLSNRSPDELKKNSKNTVNSKFLTLNNKSKTLSSQSGVSKTSNMANYNSEKNSVSYRSQKTLVSERSGQSSQNSGKYTEDHLRNESAKLMDMIQEGKVLTNVMTKSGSKLLQYCIPRVNQDILDKIFLQLSENIFLVIKNPYGNFVFQKMIENLDSEKRVQVWELIQSSIFFLCTHTLGNRSIQTLISKADNPRERKLILQHLNPYINNLSFNKFGCFVLEELLMSIPEEENEQLLSYMHSHIIDLLTDENGVCLFKKFVEFCLKRDSDQKVMICKVISKNLNLIFRDKYGHYGLIYLAEVWGIEASQIIVESLLKNISVYGMLSYSHKFLRKVYYLGDEKYREYLVKSMEKRITNFNKFLSYKVGSKTFKLVLVFYKESLTQEDYGKYFDGLISNEETSKSSAKILRELNSLILRNEE